MTKPFDADRAMGHMAHQIWHTDWKWILVGVALVAVDVVWQPARRRRRWK